VAEGKLDEKMQEKSKLVRILSVFRKKYMFLSILRQENGRGGQKAFGSSVS
jgi:hypothetical protein